MRCMLYPFESNIKSVVRSIRMHIEMIFERKDVNDPKKKKAKTKIMRNPHKK